MNLPNQLTLSRILLTFGFIYFVTRRGLLPILVASLLFAVASLTDYFDGYFAKKRNLISPFGKIMDPIADKFLILAAFFVFVRMDIVAEWMFYIIFVREVVVTGVRLMAIRRGKVLAAERAGKYKTVSQISAISVILIFLLFQEAGGSRWSLDMGQGGWASGIYILMLLTVGLTLFSGVSYLWNNRKDILFNRLA